MLDEDDYDDRDVDYAHKPLHPYRERVTLAIVIAVLLALIAWGMVVTIRAIWDYMDRLA